MNFFKKIFHKHLYRKIGEKEVHYGQEVARIRFYECDCGQRFSFIMSETVDDAIRRLCEMWAAHELEYEDI